MCVLTGVVGADGWICGQCVVDVSVQQELEGTLRYLVLVEYVSQHCLSWVKQAVLVRPAYDYLVAAIV